MSGFDNYAEKALAHEGIFSIDLTKPVRKTFGGIFATQVAFFLGYTTAYLVGFDGGTEKFYGFHTREGETFAVYHNLCMKHIHWWLQDHPQHKIYNCSKDSRIEWFEYAEAPLKDE